MLARRFTLVCLLTALFGIYAAILVVEAGRGNRPPELAGAIPALLGVTVPR